MGPGAWSLLRILLRPAALVGGGRCWLWASMVVGESVDIEDVANAVESSRGDEVTSEPPQSPLRNEADKW
jgi:hypothetical protein